MLISSNAVKFMRILIDVHPPDCAKDVIGARPGSPGGPLIDLYLSSSGFESHKYIPATPALYRTGPASVLAHMDPLIPLVCFVGRQCSSTSSKPGKTFSTWLVSVAAYRHVVDRTGRNPLVLVAAQSAFPQLHLSATVSDISFRRYPGRPRDGAAP